MSDLPGDLQGDHILFLCTGNSCRSQMAEGFGNYMFPKIKFHSAGIKPSGKVHPEAVKVMDEININISGHCSKDLTETFVQTGQPLDVVITVCSHADDNCPRFTKTNPQYSKTRIIHVGFDDPPALTKNMDSEDERLEVFRRVRDEIKLFIENLGEILTTNN